MAGDKLLRPPAFRVQILGHSIEKRYLLLRNTQWAKQVLIKELPATALLRRGYADPLVEAYKKPVWLLFLGYVMIPDDLQESKGRFARRKADDRLTDLFKCVNEVFRSGEGHLLEIRSYNDLHVFGCICYIFRK